MDFGTLYDRWLDSATQQLYEALLIEQTTDSMVQAVYEDQRKPKRMLADFDFLIKEPNRSQWVKKAFEYAVNNDLDYSINNFDDIFEMCRRVRAHRKTKRKGRDNNV